MDAFDQIRERCHDIDMRAGDIEILLKAMFDKIDSMGSDPIDAANAINCFVTCALRNAVLLKEHNEHILALTSIARAA